MRGFFVVKSSVCRKYGVHSADAQMRRAVIRLKQARQPALRGQVAIMPAARSEARSSFKVLATSSAEGEAPTSVTAAPGVTVPAGPCAPAGPWGPVGPVGPVGPSVYAQRQLLFYGE